MGLVLQTPFYSSLSKGQDVDKHMEVVMTLISKVNLNTISIPYTLIVMIIPYTCEAF